MSFQIVESAGRLEVRFQGAPILEFTNDHLLFRGFRMDNLRTRPGGPVECISLLTSCFYQAHYLRARLEGQVVDRHTARIVVTPLKVAHNLLDFIQEVRTLTIRYLPLRQCFEYQVDVQLMFLQDIEPGLPHLWLVPMKQWRDDDFAVVEFEDPLLAGGKGPQVPMTQDWRGLQEPWFDEHCFTTQWRKRFVDAVLHTSERGWRKVALHRIQSGAQQYYNRHALRCEAGTTFYYTKSDGSALTITHDHPYASGHHICEWGMDMHCYAMLPRARQDCWFAAGQRVDLRYRISEVNADELPAEVREAAVAGLEPDELAVVDMPIYEEPLCGFTTSALHLPDAGAWVVVGRGSGVWQRSGARLAHHGALVIDHGAAGTAGSGGTTWSFRYYGPSHGANPIPPLSQHRIRAWVQATDLSAFTLSLVLSHYNGPAMFSRGTEQHLTLTQAHIVASEGTWHAVDLVTAECDSNVLAGRIDFTYTGPGRAALTELSIERL